MAGGEIFECVGTVCNRIGILYIIDEHLIDDITRIGCNRESLLFTTLVQALERADVQVADSPAEATAVLRLLQDSSGQRVLSVGTQGNPEEFELFRTIQYELVAGEETLVRSQPVTVTRDYAWVETDVIGTQRQARRLDNGLANELTSLLIRTLSAAR